jgi:hypothetical protein
MTEETANAYTGRERANVQFEDLIKRQGKK